MRVRKAGRPARKTTAPQPLIVLKLYVAGTTPRSTRAIESLRRFCEMHLEGPYELEVIDIYQQPGLASTSQIIATPTLVKSVPPPARRLVGDLSDTKVVRERFRLKTKAWPR